MSTIEKALRKLADNADLNKRDQNKPLDSVNPGVPTSGIQGEVEDVALTEGGADSSAESYAGKAPLPLSSGQEDVLNIPIPQLHSLGMVTQLAPRSEAAEAYRIIKRPLLMNIAGEGAVQVSHANMIMVTSALQGEGKTFSAINLAMSIAMEQDKTVLLVDADTAKASAGELCGVAPDARGLVDVLEHKDIGIADVIMQTNISNLRIIPAGHVHERSTELLASEHMRLIMNELSERYADRVVIFDSPPILLATEASVLANYMGQIVFVVAAEETSQHAIKGALQYLGQDKVVGMVLNKYKANALDKLGYGHGHGYGYGYGYGHRHESGPGEGETKGDVAKAAG